MKDIESRYNSVSSAINSEAAQLQAAITQSQGIQEALGSLEDWLDTATQGLKGVQTISLDRAVISEQQQQIKRMGADVHRLDLL